jgi:glycosyltransferase involved in cell wall biosynthesis
LNSTPLVTVVTAVLDRPDELRRSLASLVAQSMPEFQCIVVDDASRVPIAPVVEEFDERFIYVRNESNLGPAGAKRAGFARMRGQFACVLDSDDEYFPWTLERATTHLAKHPEVGGVTGLWVFPEGFRVRFGDVPSVFTREDYVRGNYPKADCLAMVRRESVEEWLGRRDDYFATEFVWWLSHRLRHSQLFVDEPWGRKHMDARARVSTRRDPRLYRDAVTFVAEHRPEIGTEPCVPVDQFLRTNWTSLLRAGRWREARIVAAWMNERRIGKVAPMLEVAAGLARARMKRAAHRPVLKPLAQHTDLSSGVRGG